MSNFSVRRKYYFSKRLAENECPGPEEYVIFQEKSQERENRKEMEMKVVRWKQQIVLGLFWTVINVYKIMKNIYWCQRNLYID